MTSVPWLVIWIGSFDEDQKVALDRRSYLAERKYLIVHQDFPCELVNCVDNIKDGTKIAHLQSKLKKFSLYFVSFILPQWFAGLGLKLSKIQSLSY